MRKIILLAIGLVVSTPAFANPTCLMIGQIDSWKVPDDKTLIVDDQFHNRFKIGLLGSCPGMSFKERVGFYSAGATQLSCLRIGDQVIIHNFGTGRQICPIRTIVPYTPDMEKADLAAKAAAAAPGDSGAH